MSKVRLADAARFDLWEIYAYIAQEADIYLADQVRDQLIEKFKLIADNMLMGRPRSDLGNGLRSVVHKKYLIFYLPGDAEIEVLRILHSARNIDEILSSKIQS